jgi:signal transduction histidine kinase
MDLTASKSLESSLKRRIADMSVIREIDEELHSARDVTGILRAILVGATASQGLRFNRAFLFLVDEKRPEPRGRMAIGPANAEEASRIWSALARSETKLKELLRNEAAQIERDDTRVNEIVRAIRVPLDDPGSFLVRALNAGRTTIVSGGKEVGSDVAVEPRLTAQLGVDAFVAVPLVAEGSPVGLLLADNVFTGRPVDDEDVEVLEVLGMKAAFAIERAHLMRDLEIQVASLEAANRQIRQSQERLLRAERLSAVGEMAARVAHEIRNPLVAIGGFARLLLREAPAQGDMRENLQVIASEVRRLEQILRDVLDYSNPMPLRVAPCDLAKVVHEAFELLRWEMEEAHIRGSLEADPGIPEVQVDRNQIFQALINVLNNSIHAMPQGGELTVRVRRLPGWVAVHVADTGVGIDPEVLPKVFEPFFTTRSTGSGLGLTIARHIVQEHRGEITVESIPGTGTTFTFRLPVPHEGAGHVENPGR